MVQYSSFQLLALFCSVGCQLHLATLDGTGRLDDMIAEESGSFHHLLSSFQAIHRLLLLLVLIL